MANKKDKKLMGAGVLTAMAASLCCITPVLALLAGAGGIASTFSWIEPFRPYFIGITVLVLVFAWYQKLKLKTKEEIECDCEPARSAGGEEGKPSFWQSKLFLGIITVFAGVMLAFPHYSSIFYPAKKTNLVENAQSNIQELKVQVKGMTCQSCNLHVEHEVAKLPGYINAKADFKTGEVMVRFDTLKTSKKELIEKINSTGYKIIDP